MGLIVSVGTFLTIRSVVTSPAETRTCGGCYILYKTEIPESGLDLWVVTRPSDRLSAGQLLLDFREKLASHFVSGAERAYLQAADPKTNLVLGGWIARASIGSTKANWPRESGILYGRIAVLEFSGYFVAERRSDFVSWRIVPNINELFDGPSFPQPMIGFVDRSREECLHLPDCGRAEPTVLNRPAEGDRAGCFHGPVTQPC